MEKTKFVKTDLILLNEMLGGGIPVGKIIEIYGFEGCGKTTLAMELTKFFRTTYYIDFECELDMAYAKMIGAKIKRLEQPDTIEKGVDDFFHALKKERFDLLIVDTVGSGVSQEQLDKDLSEPTMGAQAQKVTIFLKKAEKILKPMGITVILLNHKKEVIGKGGFGGEKFYTPGGRYVRYASSIRLSVTKKQSNVFKGEIVSNIWMVRNKLIHENGIMNCEYTVLRGKGISRGKESFDIGLQLGVVKREGQSYKIGKKAFRGKEAVIEFLDAQAEVRKVINERWDSRDKSQKLSVIEEGGYKAGADNGDSRAD